MTAIAKLIRIHSFQLDEKRRELKKLEDQAAKIEEALANLINQVEAEKKLSYESLEAQRDYPNFIQFAFEKRDQLNKDLTAARGLIETAREGVAEAFAELKKYEIVKQKYDNEIAEELDRREQMDLDEVALNNHRLRR
ncbi:MAG: flagellar export protein FliJ [Rhodospirillaceae bacterium]|mgnify:CR=1 FL=1|nr:flagellar export protein FliJ [Rhodospirillaceae bacterium]